METLDEGMYKQKLEQIGNQPSEKDRARLIKNITNNFSMTAEQAIGLCAACHDSASKIEAAQTVYHVLKDQEAKDKFVELANASLFKYPEDRQELAEKLGVDYVEAEEAEASSGPKVSKFDKHSVSGYTV